MENIKNTKAFGLYKTLLQEYLNKITFGGEPSKLMLDTINECSTVIGGDELLEEQITVSFFIDGKGWLNYGPKSEKEKEEAIEKLHKIISGLEEDEKPTFINIDLAYMGIVTNSLTEKNFKEVADVIEDKIRKGEEKVKKLEDEKRAMGNKEEEIEITVSEIEPKGFLSRNKGKIILGVVTVVGVAAYFGVKKYLAEKVDIIEL